MIELTYFSRWGGSLSLAHNSLFTLKNIDGLTWSATDISSIVIGGIDGDSINNIQAQPRDIVLDFLVKDGVNVEQAIRQILRTIKIKQSCELQWTQNGRTWRIYGVVDAIEVPRFNSNVTLQISIHCERPFWEELEDTEGEIDEFIDMHYFTDYPDEMLYFPADGIPFGEIDLRRTRVIENRGDVAVGMVIEVLAYDTVTNPIIYAENGTYFGVGYDTKPLVMSEGDRLIINTTVGEKSVELNGVNVLDKIKPSSTWLQLQAGENEFSINSDDDVTNNMAFTLSYRQRYV